MEKKKEKSEWQIEQIVDETYLLIKSFDFKKIGEDLEHLPFCNIFMKWHDGRSKRRECKPKDLAILLFILKKRREKINSLIEEIENFLNNLSI